MDDPVGDAVVVDTDRREGDDVQVEGAAVRRRDVFQDGLQRDEDAVPLGFIIGPQGPFQFGRFRDDIRIMAGLELAEREDDTVAVSVAVVDGVLKLVMLAGVIRMIK